MDPLALQYGALGLAGIVITLTARLITKVMDDSAKREQLFFAEMQKQREQFALLSQAFNQGFGQIVSRLEAIEERMEENVPKAKRRNRS